MAARKKKAKKKPALRGLTAAEKKAAAKPGAFLCGRAKA